MRPTTNSGLGAQSLVWEPVGPFLVPTFSGDPWHPVSPNSRNNLAAWFCLKLLSLPPPRTNTGHIQFQVRAFVLYAKFILASAQLGVGGGSAELSLKVGSVVGAT